MNNIVIFRNDLRIYDHNPLQAALAQSENIIAITFLNKTLLQSYGWGEKRFEWQLKNINCLRADLKKNFNIDLLIYDIPFNETEHHYIVKTCLSLNPKNIYAGIECGFNERIRDKILRESFLENNVNLNLLVSETVLSMDIIENKSGNPYKVYSPFRRMWDYHFFNHKRDIGKNYSQQGCFNDCLENGWKPGTDSALVQLDYFVNNKINDYHGDRDRPDLDGTSLISPWLCVGAISPSMCLEPLVQKYGLDIEKWPKGPKHWRQEIVWREFYKYVTSKFDVVSKNKPLQQWTDRIKWNHDQELFKKWCIGETGIDLVDAAMKQMNHIGWMHNRLRMVVAMFLTKNLLIDWRLGEKYFANKLIDYDFSSNSGGWQWAASTGTDAAPYFRIFNPDSQADKFDPDNKFRAKWLSGSIRPEPIVDLKKSRAEAIEVFKSAKDEFNK